MPSWGCLPLRCSSHVQCSDRPVSTRCGSHAAAWIGDQTCRPSPVRPSPPDRAGTSRVRRLPARCRQPPERLSNHGQNTPDAPSSRLTVLPAGRFSSRRHPWGFPLQRFDRILSRTPLGSPCPSVPRQPRFRSVRHPETPQGRDARRFSHRPRLEIVRPGFDVVRGSLARASKTDPTVQLRALRARPDLR